MRSRVELMIVALVVACALAGCSQPVESTARDGIAAASGFLRQEVTANTAECQANPAIQKCVAIKKATQTLTVAIDALEAYCGSPAFNSGNAPCQPPTNANLKQQLVDKLASVLKDLNRDIADVKAITNQGNRDPDQIPVSRADMTGSGILALVSLLLPLLKGLLDSATKSNLPGEVIDSVQVAIDALEKFHGSAVTREQLESLKVDAPWGK